MHTQYFLLPIFLFASLFVQSQTANRFDIVIDEIMIDPTPQIGLPNNEWIELRNTSTTTFNLLGWKLAMQQGKAVPCHRKI